ncbi:MAG: hypothetical protein ACOCV9_02650 [Marinilabiliaceae bacterium]
MRSKTFQRILDKTPKEVKEKVRQYTEELIKNNEAQQQNKEKKK